MIWRGSLGLAEVCTLMSSSYDKPDWSASPPASADTHPFKLEILKDGAIIGEIPLIGREYFLVGRQHDVVHIPMDHLSISRRHAALNFRNDGALMLLDLGSIQGTTLNRKPCEAGTYYRVYVGDLLRFGASTRQYVLSGPSEFERQEYESENLDRLRREATEKSKRLRVEQQRREEDESSVSWGISDDTDPEDRSDNSNSNSREKGKSGTRTSADRDDTNSNDDNRSSRSMSDKEKQRSLPEYLRKDENYDRKFGEKFEADINEAEISNSKDIELREKIRKKERKVQNMQEENRRIFVKESSQDGGMTDGQQKAVERNDKAMAQLAEEINALIKQLRSKNAQREISSSSRSSSSSGGGGTVEGSDGVGSRKRTAREALVDEDDVLDITSCQSTEASDSWRTRRKLNKTPTATAAAVAAIAGSSSDALTYTEITAKLDASVAALAAIQQELCNSRNKEASLQSTIDQHKSGSMLLEDVELIVKQHQLHDATTRRKRHEEEAAKLAQQITGLQQLQKIAAPALLSLARDKKSATSAAATTAAAAAAANNSGKTINTTSSDVIATAADAAANDSIAAIAATVATQDHLPPTIAPIAPPIVNSMAATFAAPEQVKELTSEQKLRLLQREIEADKQSEEDELQRKKQLALVDAEKQAAACAVAKENRQSTSQQKSVTATAKQRAVVTAATTSAATKAATAVAAAAAAESFDPLQLQGGDFVWVPPKNQRGDGKTSLNDKLGY